MDQLTSKINKLPRYLVIDDVLFELSIKQCWTNKKSWKILYSDDAGNGLFEVIDYKLEACIDTTLCEIKNNHYQKKE